MTISHFHGSNVIFWIGCVEDINDDKADDKLKLGRVRVRVMGYHSQTKEENNKTGEGIPVDKLLWAYPLGPVTSASISGLGQSPLGIVKGTWVMGLSMDGVLMQDLYIIGTLAGVPEEPVNPADQGFCDPTGKYPLKEFLKESDINRLARNDKDKPHPMLAEKERERIKNIPVIGGETWDEPASNYNAIYPHNYVTETPNGHIIEIDDSPLSRRTHRWHPSGTYEEIDVSGSRMTKIIGADFEIVLDAKNLYVIGNLNITVGGNANILVKGDCNIESVGNMDISSRKDMAISADNLTINAKTLIVTTEDAMTMKAGGPLSIWGADSDANDAASGII